LWWVQRERIITDIATERWQWWRKRLMMTK
jgi:hypothetical protein